MFWCRFRFRRGILKENVVFPVKMAEDLPIVSVHITNTLGIYPLFILPYFYLSPDFYICRLSINIIVKNNQLCILWNNNNFQENLSKNKEMTFTETNNGPKSIFAYG